MEQEIIEKIKRTCYDIASRIKKSDYERYDIVPFCFLELLFVKLLDNAENFNFGLTASDLSAALHAASIQKEILDKFMNNKGVIITKVNKRGVINLDLEPLLHRVEKNIGKLNKKIKNGKQ